MPVVSLKKDPSTYTCNSYLIHSGIKYDTHGVLIDPGVNRYTIDEVYTYKGFAAKPPIHTIIHTHNHFDHAAGTTEYLKMWKDLDVIAFSKSDLITKKAYDGLQIDLGYDTLRILHTPGHTADSIAIYLEKEKALFTGDTPIFIRTNLGSYHRHFVRVLERFHSMEISAIYSGHDNPMTKNIKEYLHASIKNVKNSKIID